jgi:radical SAM protein with 4Fe4S-binding SPASM domain
MKARLLNNEAPGGSRRNLADNLPLSTPYLVQIFPIYACNFRCKYCHHSIPKEDRGFVTDCLIMDFELYEKCIHDLAQFPEKIKTLRFVGMGEPLLHKDIVRMVQSAKEKDVANTIEILTNGSLLAPELSDQLIDAGLDRLVISLQGTSAEKYRDISGIKLDFDEFINNIRYFYDKRKNVHMYLKIVDIALDNEEDKATYFRIFGDICDTIGIETAVPIFSDVEFNKDLETAQVSKTQFGLPYKPVKVCPQAFYSMQINPDGKIVGCHSIYYPRILDDCTNKSLVDIWNGEGYTLFRRQMLDGRKNVGQLCEECKINDFRMFPEDDISPYAEELKKWY